MLEMDLPQIQNGKAQTQLGALVEAYHTFIRSLLAKLSEEEFTFVRYKEAADEVLQVSINNYRKVIALAQSIPTLDVKDQHPVRKLVMEQKILIDTILKRNATVIEQLQEMAIGWSRVATTAGNSEVNQLLDQLKSLKSQIEKYDA